MICKNCGAQLDLRKQECPNCGNPRYQMEEGNGFWDLLDGQAKTSRQEESAMVRGETKKRRERKGMPIWMGLVCIVLSLASLVTSLTILDTSKQERMEVALEKQQILSRLSQLEQSNAELEERMERDVRESEQSALPNPPIVETSPWALGPEPDEWLPFLEDATENGVLDGTPSDSLMPMWQGTGEAISAAENDDRQTVPDPETEYMAPGQDVSPIPFPEDAQEREYNWVYGPFPE